MEIPILGQTVWPNTAEGSTFTEDSYLFEDGIQYEFEDGILYDFNN